MLHPLDQEIQTLRGQPALTLLDQLHLQTLTRMRTLAQQLQPWDGRPADEISPDVQVQLNQLHKALTPEVLMYLWVMLKQSHQPWMAPWFEVRVMVPVLTAPPVRAGRPRATALFDSPEEFRESVMALIRLCVANDYRPTQQRIAGYLRQSGVHTKSDNIDSIVRALRRYCARLDVTWTELVEQARSLP
jgi:hypothetical protein